MLERDDFSKYMNAPEDYEPTRSEIDSLLKIKQIIENGNRAIVKRKSNGEMAIFEERMKKHDKV